MVSDRERVSAYVAALQAAVRPGTVVVDLGAGTGFFSLVACELGARRVYAIERDDVVTVAEEIAQAAGYRDRIVFLHASSFEVELPERADVIVSDLRGRLPLYGRHLPAVIDARERLLAAGGTMIPMRDVVSGLLVDAGERYERLVAPWTPDRAGFDMTPAQKYVLNSLCDYRSEGTALSAPFVVAEIDYRTVQGPGLRSRVTATATAAGVVNGVVLWFDAEVGPEARFTNGPAERPGAVYRKTLFPLGQPLEVTVDDELVFDLRADLLGDDYTWTWSLSRAGEADPRLQSTLLGTPVPRDRLTRADEGFAPVPSREAKIDRLGLDLMDGRRTLGEIADALLQADPDAFAGRQEALDRAARLSLRYGERPAV